MKIDANKAGLSLGLTFVVMHFIWLILVFIGFGDFIFKWAQGLHFLSSDYGLGGFDFVTAIIGLVGAFILGYLIGFLFSFIWKLLNK